MKKSLDLLMKFNLEYCGERQIEFCDKYCHFWGRYLSFENILEINYELNWLMFYLNMGII